MAFNAKNLSYEAPVPSFLQRLKANHDESDGRNNVQHARPGGGKSRLKMGDGDEDEGPVIVDEGGEVVEKKVWEDMVSSSANERKTVDGDRKADAYDDEGRKQESEIVRNERMKEKQKQNLAEIGVGKKRKAIKVVGGGEGDTQEGMRRQADTEKQEVSKSGNVQSRSQKTDSISKPKKKAKKIKLSFDNPE